MNELLQTFMILLLLCAATAAISLMVIAVKVAMIRRDTDKVDHMNAEIKELKAQRNDLHVRNTNLTCENVTLRELNGLLNTENEALECEIRELQKGKPALHIKGRITKK